MSTNTGIEGAMEDKCKQCLSKNGTISYVNNYFISNNKKNSKLEHVHESQNYVHWSLIAE